MMKLDLELLKGKFDKYGFLYIPKFFHKEEKKIKKINIIMKKRNIHFYENHKGSSKN